MNDVGVVGLTQYLETKAAMHFNYRANIVVPNVSWGMGLMYEADLVVLRPTGFAVEVEIKTNAADIVADTKKRHRHDSSLFRELWFCVPVGLVEHPSIPERAGILGVDIPEIPGVNKKDSRALNSYLRVAGLSHRGVHVVRKPKIKKSARQWTDNQRMKLLHLAAMRIWGLKTKLIAQQFG